MILPGSYANGFAPRDGEPLYPELWQGCVGDWSPCLGPTGLVLRDWSGRANHGTLTNMDPGTDWVTSGDRYALDFNYVSSNSRQAVQLPETASLGGLGEVTLSLWFNPQSIPGITASIYYESTTITGFRRFGIHHTNTNQIVGLARDTQGGSAFTITTSPAVGWQHLMLTYSAASDDMTLYLNGVSVGTNSAAKGVLSSGTPADPIAIGAFTQVGSFAQSSVDAMIDDVRIYSRVLSNQSRYLLAARRGIAHELAPVRYAGSAGFLASWNRQQSFIIGGGLQ